MRVGISFIALVFLFGCAGTGKDSVGRTGPGFGIENRDIEDQSSLVIQLINEVQEDGSETHSIKIELNNTQGESNLPWSDENQLDERFEVHFIRDNQDASIELQLDEDNVYRSLPTPKLRPEFFEALHRADIVISKIDSPSLNQNGYSAVTPEPLSTLGEKFPSLGDRILSNCTIGDPLADTIRWENRGGTPIRIVFEDSSETSVEISALDDGYWRIGEGTSSSALAFFEIFFSSSDIDFADTSDEFGFYSQLNKSVSQVLIRSPLKQTLRLNTNPPRDLPVEVFVIEQSDFNLVYKGGCQ